MRWSILFFLSMLVLLAFSGCAPDDETDPEVIIEEEPTETEEEDDIEETVEEQFISEDEDVEIGEMV